MGYRTNSNDFLILGFGLMAFGSAVYLHQKFERPIINISKQESATNLDSAFLKFFSLGNKRLISNTLWIQTLLESDEQKYSNHDKNSWMFHRFNTIASLDPKFYENYLYGGMYLSIIKDDLEGAADIYEKGLKIYPDDYKLNYNAGFNYYFEMADFENGLKKLEKIVHSPEMPQALKFIINKIKFETGRDYNSALSFLYFSISQTKDEVLLRKLHSDFYALKAERDLECLNNNQENCDLKDAEGNLYLKVNNKWQAIKEYKPYRIHLREKK